VTRGQSNLLAVAMAMLTLTAATGLGLALADAAFVGGQRHADERRVAVALSERLVAPSSPLTARRNVLNASAVDEFDATALDAGFRVVGDRAVRLRLDDRTIAERGEPTASWTVRRIVLVQRRERVTRTPSLASDDGVTLPRRTPRVRLTVDPPSATTVETVRVDGRVVLRNESGLDGTFTVETSRLETVRLTFEASGPLPRGAVQLAYYPATTTKATLEVTVGA
jgi:hypothetical protein